MYARDGNLKSWESIKTIPCTECLYLRKVKIVKKEGDSNDWIQMPSHIFNDRSCQQDNENLGFIKGGKFSGRLSFNDWARSAVLTV